MNSNDCTHDELETIFSEIEDQDDWVGELIFAIEERFCSCGAELEVYDYDDWHVSFGCSNVKDSEEHIKGEFH